jgi:[ribosomal protein S5]-alanine N-acetyltransferase
MQAFDQVTLRTDRLFLRPLVASDADSLFAVFSDPTVMRYWGTPPWSEVTQAQELIGNDVEDMLAGKIVSLGIELLSSSQLIGTCTLFRLMRECKRAEIGFGMASSFWGNGYMHEALQTLLAFGFHEIGLNRIEADVDPRNLASIKCLERLGFQKEGLLRERWIVKGEVSDSYFYGLLHSDWRAKNLP